MAREDQVRVGKEVSVENEGFDAGAERLKTDAIKSFFNLLSVSSVCNCRMPELFAAVCLAPPSDES
jgi:hypothetical protein